MWQHETTFDFAMQPSQMAKVSKNLPCRADLMPILASCPRVRPSARGQAVAAPARTILDTAACRGRRSACIGQPTTKGEHG